MTARIRSAPHGGVRITIGPAEAQLLRSMADLLLHVIAEPEQQDELAALVGISSSATKPEDPALARLFPDAYADDADAAADFRRYTEDDLRRHKRENARRVASAIPDGGGEITLDSEDVQTWLKALTDVRLYLGVRLGIATEEDVEAIRAAAARDESLATAVHVYDWLTYIQDSLVRAAWEEE